MLAFASRRVVENTGSNGLLRTLKKLCQEGWLHKALQAVEQMDLQGIPLSTNILFCLLQGCIKKEDIAAGRKVHALIVRRGMGSNSFLGSHLIRMFASCGSLLEANRVFSRLLELNVFSWGAIISAHANLGQGNQAIELYKRMQMSGIKADGHVFVAALKACASATGLTEGKLIHAHISENGYESNVYVGNALIYMYAKCGCLQDAHRIFDRLQCRDIVTWNAIIAGYIQLGGCHKALQLVQQMQQEGVKSDQATFVCILQGCANVSDLKQGKLIHALIVQAGFESNLFLGSTLLDMYVKCGNLDDACIMFCKLLNRDVVAWNVMIEGYIQHENGQEALKMFQQMLQDGIMPNEVTFVSILRACSSIAALDHGKLVHSQIIQRGFWSNVFLGNTLIDTYAKCGSIKDADIVFYRLPERDVVTWNAIIAGYVQHGDMQEALKLCQQMKQECIIPNQVTFMSILKACANMTGLELGKLIHVHIIFSAFDIDLSLWNTLLDMYSKCGSLGNAKRVFDTLPERGIVAWSTMISGYAHHGYSKEALQLFEQMQQEGIEPNRVTFICILKACSNILALELGKVSHAYIIESDWDLDIFISSALIDMYSKCSSLEDAQIVFKAIPKPEVVSWSAIIGAYAQYGYCLEATHLFWQMRQEGMEPNCVTWNVLIAGYAEHGQLQEVFQLFEHMQREGPEPNWFTFACIVKACASIAALDKGRLIHSHMIESALEFDFVIGSSLISMYSKCGSLDDAYAMFEKLTEHDVVAWNAMISAYAQNDHCQEALQLFQQMLQKGFEPSNGTFVSVLTACASAGTLEQGKLIHFHIIQGGFESDVCTGNALIDMYSKCGSIREARRVFDKLEDRDVVTWSAMMAGYGQNYDRKLAMQCFEDMQHESVKPNHVTFVNLLAACSRVGLVEEACYQFKSMQEDHGIFPTAYHYNCIVELLGRAGLLIEAEDLLQSVPFQLYLVGLTSLLNHCNRHGNVEVGKWCFDSIYTIDSRFAAGYSLMSNIYTDAGLWEDAVRIEELRNFVNAWKKPGKACVEIGNKVHNFIVGDKSHPQSKEIYAKLKRLHEQMIGASSNARRTLELSPWPQIDCL